MASPEVGQLKALSDLFAEALAIRRPESVAILGVAGGNGLEHIDPSITSRVVGFDINASYLEEVRRRFAGLSGLELLCQDLARESLPSAFEPLRLVHAALVFEHAGTGLCLENALSLVTAGGALSVVLQLQSEAEEGVSRSPFSSLQSLKDDFALVDPDWLRETLVRRQFRLCHESRRPVTRGKSFWMGIFERPGRSM